MKINIGDVVEIRTTQHGVKPKARGIVIKKTYTYNGLLYFVKVPTKYLFGRRTNPEIITNIQELRKVF